MHFAVWVVVPQDEVDALGAVEAAAERLAPYDQEREVTAEEQECYCVGEVARREVEEWSAVAHADLREDMRLSGGAQSVVMTRIHAEREMRIILHPKCNDAASTCPSCGGSGQQTVHYNPEARWDWWEVGGRWDGEFDPAGSGRNVIPVAEVGAVSAQVVPHSFIDSEGQWREMDDPWSNDAGQFIAWQSTVQAELDRSPTATLVCVDCHF